ncbi:hypothetical protein LTR95_006108 [Oleoguttula sp. CCFEE 5521]
MSGRKIDDEVRAVSNDRQCLILFSRPAFPPFNDMNIDPSLTSPAPPPDRNHMFFTLCYPDSINAQIICICYPPGTSVVQALQAELAQRNLIGIPTWHYPIDSHEEVNDLEELETMPDALRQTLLRLHLEEPESDGDEAQLAIEVQTAPEQQEEADQASEEEILYDSDEASEYVRTPVRTRRTAREQEQVAAEEPDEPYSAG